MAFLLRVEFSTAPETFWPESRIHPQLETIRYGD
jgi:hypothetical protein